MSVDPRDLVRPFYAAFESGAVDALDAVFSPGWVDSALPPGRPPGLAGMKQAITGLRVTLPDLRCVVEDLLADGDRIIARITFSGTNTGGFAGVAPNGAAVRFIAFDVHRVADGRIVESWHLEDNLSLLIQLGVIPPLG